MKMLFHPETGAAVLAGSKDEAKEWLSLGYLTSQPAIKRVVDVVEEPIEAVKAEVKEVEAEVEAPETTPKSKKNVFK